MVAVLRLSLVANGIFALVVVNRRGGLVTALDDVEQARVERDSAVDQTGQLRDRLAAAESAATQAQQTAGAAVEEAHAAVEQVDAAVERAVAAEESATAAEAAEARAGRNARPSRPAKRPSAVPRRSSQPADRVTWAPMGYPYASTSRTTTCPTTGCRVVRLAPTALPATVKATPAGKTPVWDGQELVEWLSDTEIDRLLAAGEIMCEPASYEDEDAGLECWYVD